MAARPIKRPVVRYHGGKWILAPWIISHFPNHRIYVEPFGGGGSVLMRKPRSYAEIYNDKWGDIVNVFRVLRDNGPEIANLLSLTPFSRNEFELAGTPCDDPIERARRTIFRSFAGHGSAAIDRDYRTGFRANSNRSGTTAAHDWRNYPVNVAAFTERLRGVVIENRDALDVMRQHDTDETLHYVDPPYVHESRSSVGAYAHELADEAHKALLEFLHTLRGAVVLSGYRNAQYDEILKDWTRIDRAALADGAKARVESLWLNSIATQHGQQMLALEGRA